VNRKADFKKGSLTNSKSKVTGTLKVPVTLLYPKTRTRITITTQKYTLKCFFPRLKQELNEFFFLFVEDFISTKKQCLLIQPFQHEQ